jgi:hypothetical protein
MSIIKIIILGIVSYMGIKHFSSEMFQDMKNHTGEYSIGVGSGLLTYFSIPFKIDVANPITMECIKLFFAVLTVTCVIPVQFIIRKILDKVYHKYFNNKNK